VEVTTAERYASGGELGELPAPNLIQAFYDSVDRLGDDAAIRTQDDSYSISWNELRDRVHRIAGGLAKLGVKKGDTVALMLNNRPEFIPCDLAAVALGGVPFSVYQTSSPEQIQYVCDHAKAKVAIVETMFLDQFNKARADMPSLEKVIVVDGDGGDHTLAELEEMDPDFDPAPIVDELTSEDLLTLIYTSGTTGPPKGVQLTHMNLMALTGGVHEMIDLPERGAKVISWLPAAHIAERGAHYYLPVVRGVTVTICPDPRKIGESLAAVKPTWFFAVPRVWEKMKAGIEAKIAGLPDEQREGAEAALRAAG
jgi:long-subunit acyl-CoA synthetase (AMP-forming)